MEFEGAILQDARAGQAGFSTKLKVQCHGSTAELIHCARDDRCAA